jgi:hypothetical protein
MAAPARKEPAPASATDKLDALRAAEENERRGADIVRENEARVAAAERAHAEALADMVEGKVAAEVAAEKGAALADAARELESTRKAHEILIGRLAAARREQQNAAKAEAIKALQRKFDKRLTLAREYEAIEKERGKVWAALHKVVAEITAAWPGSVPMGCLLDKTSLRLAWESEVYRQHANPDMLGGAGFLRPDGPPTIPGARAGDLTKIWQPEKLQSFVDAVAQANAFLLSTLNGSTPVAAADIPAVNGASAPAVEPAPAQAGVAAAMSATNGQGEARIAPPSPQRTEAQRRRDLALQELHRLSEDVSEQGELRYKAQLERVRQVEEEVAAEQGVEMQHG